MMRRNQRVWLVTATSLLLAAGCGAAGDDPTQQDPAALGAGAGDPQRPAAPGDSKELVPTDPTRIAVPGFCPGAFSSFGQTGDVVSVASPSSFRVQVAQSPGGPFAVDASRAIFRKSSPADIKVGARVTLCSYDTRANLVAQGSPILPAYPADNIFVILPAVGATLGQAPRTAPPGDGRTSYLNNCANCHNDPLVNNPFGGRPSQVRIRAGSGITRGAGNPAAITAALRDVCGFNNTLGPLRNDEINDLANFLRSPS